MNADRPRWSLAAAGILGASAVAAGAFGAHGLRDLLTPRMLDIWETAASYQLVHALALLALGLVSSHTAALRIRLWTTCCFLGGTLVFSGSLYLLALTGIGWLGAVTPVGGTLLIIGWLLVFASAILGYTANP